MLSKVFLSTLLAAALILTLFDDNETFAIEYYKPPSQITGVTETIVSPDGHFELFYRREEVRGIFNQMYSDHQIWIRSKTEQEKPVLLYSYGRDANVSWSPDSTMVALTDFEGSSNSHVVIFRISP
jgi:hypothetical protein